MVRTKTDLAGNEITGREESKIWNNYKNNERLQHGTKGREWCYPFREAFKRIGLC